MLVSIHFYHFQVKGIHVEVHKFTLEGSTHTARRVYHPHNHAWLECPTPKALRMALRAIIRNVRILG